MEKMFFDIQALSFNRRRTIKRCIIFFMSFQAIWIFPLTFEISLFNLVMVYSYFIVGFILCALIERKSILILLGIMMANGIGLILRIGLEWGEVTLTEKLSLYSVLLTYLPVVFTTYAGYVYAKRSVKDKA